MSAVGQADGSTICHQTLGVPGDRADIYVALQVGHRAPPTLLSAPHEVRKGQQAAFT
jgi:hypothetical protein